MNGTIKSLPPEKRFGFIGVEGREKDIFFHESELSGVTFDELKLGDKLTFDIVEGVEGGKGPSATKISRA